MEHKEEAGGRLLMTGQTRGALEVFMKEFGQPAFRLEQLLDWVFKKRVRSFAEMKNLPAGLRAALEERYHFGGLETVRCLGAKDTTRKFLFRLPDGALIETVLIPANPALYGEASDRLTLCVSSQVGCAYGCRFCASGLEGFSRNLEAGEIVEQVMRAEAEAGERVSNLVFMGMGEPLANWPNLKAALEILNAPWGVGIGARHMTVSTSGLAPQIRELADFPMQIRLAVSLHGATDEVRGQIMPVNRRYPVAELMDACAYFASRRTQFITFEYILIEGVNDRDEDARELANLAKALKAKVNCIPYNTVEGLEWVRPSEARCEAFTSILKFAGVTATLRREKGHDIDAACGQLRRQTIATA